MKKILKFWDILTDEEKSFAPNLAMSLIGMPLILILACMIGEWFNK